MNIDEETIEWIFETWRWLFQSFGGAQEFLDSTPLVVPTEQFFPIEATGDHTFAREMFNRVLRYARLEDWRFELALDDRGDVAEILKQHTHGMTSAPENLEPDAPLEEGDSLPMLYSLKDLEDPIGLVAQLARSLSFYLLQTAPDPPPGGDDNFDYAVDVGAVFLGFGVFTANAAFQFKQLEEGLLTGWGYSRQGSLEEPEIGYALAVFGTLLDLPDREVKGHLKKNPWTFYKKARKDVKRRTDLLNELRLTKGAQFDGPYR